jgi:hypothetical protein
MHITRFKAASIHIAISATIALLVSTLMLLLWYMPPLFSALGGQQVLLILLGVDVTLGPLITLIIFNPKKSRKALSIDLMLIGIIQLSALLYGIFVVFQARPVFAVFNKGSFDLVIANSIRKEDLAKAHQSNFQSLSLTGPVYVYTEMPKNSKESSEIVLGMFSGKDLPEFPQYYTPYSEHMVAAASTAKPLAELRKLNPNNISEIDTAIRSSGHNEADLAYIPMRAKVQDLTVLVGKNDGEIIQLLKLRPW